MTALAALEFETHFTRDLRADEAEGTHPRQVRGADFSRVDPTPTSDPELIAVSDEVATLLGVTEQQLGSDAFRDLMTGNLVLPGMEPFAMRYGGHQFGNWAGQLGDGRAVNLGELVTPGGDRQMLQLKGAGPTPYSRSADGLAVLRSSIREFLCSEAMFHLGVPTTRALSLGLTGDRVMRDMLYDGHPELEPGAVVCRVAPSFIRFGNFELPAALDEVDQLRALADHTIREYFPDLVPSSGQPTGETYVALFGEVVRLTADMIVGWQRVGFVHGVMNTDNMSILGLTIDFGPYGWVENYDPDWTPNTTDRQGRRYRFGNQPGVAQWNLAQLANALLPLIDDTGAMQAELDRYSVLFTGGHEAVMASKLGFALWKPDSDEALLSDLLDLFSAAETDMTLFYRGLADVPVDDETLDTAAQFALLEDAFYEAETQLTDSLRLRWHDWLDRYSARARFDGVGDAARRDAMNRVNPLYVMRNYLAQLAIDASTEGDHSQITDLLDVMRNPYSEQLGKERFAAKRPDWARTRVGCSMLSCSS